MADDSYINNCFLRINNTNLGTGNTSGIVGNTLYFSNMPPELGSSKSANVNPVHILGRSNPLWIYSSSGERSWNLELQFISSVGFSQPLDRPLTPEEAENINKFAVRQQVLDKVNWCESLVYPIYIENISRGIPGLTFVFGDMLNVNCICTNVSTSFPGPWYISSQNTVGFPMLATVTLELKQAGGRSYSHLDVRNNLHNGPRIT